MQLNMIIMLKQLEDITLVASKYGVGEKDMMEM
jgi:hypothetical protein